VKLQEAMAKQGTQIKELTNQSKNSSDLNIQGIRKLQEEMAS
jgi:hypothetical protein